MNKEVLEDDNNIQCYPKKPDLHDEEIIINTIPYSKTIPKPHQIWSEGNLKYTSVNLWNKVSKETKEKCRIYLIEGVDIRLLDNSHFLSGEYGLFATKRFSKFDIIGEYTGKIVDKDTSGHYVAALENKEVCDSLGIDAQLYGNEMRFINSYMNIDFQPNVAMRTVYINTYPHIVIVCIENIDIDDELLLDYGEEYNKFFLQNKKVISDKNISNDIIRKALPGYESDSSRGSSSTD